MNTEEFFATLKKDAVHIEQAMDHLENTLSRPLQIFQLSKFCDAEKVMVDELSRANEILQDIVEQKTNVSSNVSEVSDFLKKAYEFEQYMRAQLEAIGSELKPYGHQKLEMHTPTSMESGIESLSLVSSGDSSLVNGNNFEESPDYQPVVRELNFSMG